MTPAALARLLARLAPPLEALDEPWVIIGSGAMMILGFPIADCPDLDILTTTSGAQALEAAWVGWRAGAYAPEPGAPFRSRFSRHVTTEGAFEVMGDLELRDTAGWRPVRADAVERRAFGGGLWPIPTGVDQLRILKAFGRPKDLVKAEALARWLEGQPPA